jgi:hypothetical protein
MVFAREMKVPQLSHDGTYDTYALQGIEEVRLTLHGCFVSLRSTYGSCIFLRDGYGLRKTISRWVRCLFCQGQQRLRSCPPGQEYEDFQFCVVRSTRFIPFLSSRNKRLAVLSRSLDFGVEGKVYRGGL